MTIASATPGADRVVKALATGKIDVTWLPTTVPIGSGTANTIPLWLTSSTVGNSLLAQSGSIVTLTGTMQALVAATQDAVRLAGRAGGTTSLTNTFTTAALTASRTQTARDASGNLCLDTVDNAFTVTQRFNAAEAIALGVTPTAGNGLVQLLSGTTKANGVAFGTDTFLYRTAANVLRNDGQLGLGMSPTATSMLMIKQSGDASNPACHLERSTNDSYFRFGYRTTTNSWQFNASFVSTGAYAPLSFLTSDLEQLQITTGGAVLALSATGGMGYGTGAGGTVTQITSRTTGVTINKITGAITLVSAAGSVAWQSFTVTNSAVAATDTIICNQVSGTDLNMIHVTAVAAGSFRISFATTSGVTVEQPVFRFTVLKSVSA